MSHFKWLFQHELRQQIASLKFITMGGFAVLFGLISFYVQTEDYKGRKAIYDEEVMEVQTALEKVTLYSRLTVPLLIPPSPLAPFAKGVDDLVGSRIDINLMKSPQFENTSQKKNPFLDIFDAFDLTTAVHILFSVMALFLVSDAIAGEREAGTLRQIFANNVLKSQYFLAKFLGSLVVLAIPLTIIYLASSIYLLLDPAIVLSGQHWLTVVNIYISSLIFVSVFILIGLTLSARSSSSSRASLAGLVLWIIMVFLYPNATRYLVNSVIPVPSSDELNAAIQAVQTETVKAVEAVAPPEGTGPASYNWYSGGDYRLPLLISATSKQAFEYHRTMVQRGLPLVLDGMDRIFAVRMAHKENYARQQAWAAALNRLLPGQLLTESAAKIAGTHYSHRDLEILESAHAYHQILADYIKDQGGFGYSFFTQLPESEMKINYSDYTSESMQKYSPNSYEPLDLGGMPVWQPPGQSALPSAALIDLLLMLGLAAGFFIIGGLLFSHSDVRVRH